MEEQKTNLLSVAFESFVYGCCYTAMKTFMVLPEKASAFKKLGGIFIRNYVSKKISEDLVCEINEGYMTAKEIAEAVKNDKEEKVDEDK